MTWHLIGSRLPPADRPVDFSMADGSILVGWVVYRKGSREPICRVWGDGARLPSRYDSRHLKAGVCQVWPMAWRRHVAPKMLIPTTGPIGRREAEVIMRRAILTDGFRRSDERNPGSQVRSSWASEWHDDRDAWNEAYGRHEESTRFVPENFDIDNELVAMRWFAELGTGGRRFSRKQVALLWRALGFSYRSIGDKLGRLSGETARSIYNGATDDVWSLALRDQASVWRLPKHYWDTERADAVS